MITITHRCGHTTPYTPVEIKFGEAKAKEKLAKLGKTISQFNQEQIEWHSLNDCPGCYVPRPKRTF